VSSWCCGKSPPNSKDLVGQRFSRVTVVEKTHMRRGDGSVFWRCSDGKLRVSSELHKMRRREPTVPWSACWWDPDESGGGV
jgi:hypothetical protein